MWSTSFALTEYHPRRTVQKTTARLASSIDKLSMIDQLAWWKVTCICRRLEPAFNVVLMELSLSRETVYLPSGR